MEDMSTNKTFQVGDWVQWNGGASQFHPRIYVGQVVEVREHSYMIVDNEWFATSEVRKQKVSSAVAKDAAAKDAAAKGAAS